MKTAMILMMQFESALIPLEDICDEYFQLNKRTATDRAKSGTLPVQAFQLNESRKAPWFIHVNDLAEMIDRRREEARREFVGVAA